MRNVAIGILLVLAALAGFVALQPAEFLITRTRTMPAPPELVHSSVNDFHKWTEWSPWEKRDPGMQRTYEGAPSGPGASYHWSGNEQVGEGRMTITESEPPGRVAIRLEFLKPFPATNTAEFFIDAAGLGTEVTWAMTGRNDFVGKAFALFMDMDKAVGGDFEQGLAALDAVTTAAMKAAPAPEPAPAELVPGAEAPPVPGAEAPPAPTGEAPPAP